MDDLTEYEITMRLRANSSLEQKKLKELLVVALWVDTEAGVVIPDGITDELQVLEYEEIVVEVAG